jgi:RNA polymerase sigma-70 factor (ECF subfamily)
MIDPAVADQALVTALRRGDETAFVGLVERFHRPLVRMAIRHVRDPDVAEEVVQETWIAVVKGLGRFEGRSSLQTWIFRIATFQAKTRGQRERRNVPLSSLLDDDSGGGGPSVDPGRFQDSGQWTGHWKEPPATWGGDIEQRLLSAETRGVIDEVLAGLSEAQRTVMTLRDLDGFGSDEVCAMLEISPGNQRVLLHRARSRVRAALERYVAEAQRV